MNVDSTRRPSWASGDDDRAADRRILVAFGLMMAAQIALAVLADAGVYPLWAWLVLAIVAVLIGGGIWALVQRQAGGGD